MLDDVPPALDEYGFRENAYEREPTQKTQTITTCITALVSLIAAYIIYEIWKYCNKDETSSQVSGDRTMNEFVGINQGGMLDS